MAVGALAGYILNFNLTGDLTTQGDASFSIDNSNGGFTGGNASLNVDISGAINSGNETLFAISNEGGTIGSDVTLNVSAANVSLAGNLDFVINNFNEGQIGGNALINAIVTGDISATSAGLAINSNGGSIAGNATLLLTTTNILTDQGPFFPQIFNQDGGMISGDATVTINAADITVNGSDGGAGSSSFNSIIFNWGGQINGAARIHIAASGDVVAQQASSFQILSEDIGSGVGSVGTDATILVEAASYSTGADLAAIIGNEGASIGGNASAGFDISGAVISQASCGLFIGDTGGTISADALLDFLAGSATIATDFTEQIINQDGAIGGDAGIMLATGGAFTSATIFQAIGNENASIGGDASITMSAASFTTNSFFAAIDSSFGGVIGGGATVGLSVTNDIIAQTSVEFGISNNDDGQITGDARVNLSAANVSSPAGGLLFSIFNQLGSIGGDSAIQLNVSGDITAAQADIGFQNWNFGVGPPAGTIGGDALISVSAANISAPSGTLFATILNQNAGLISGNAIINFTLSGDINAQDVNFIIDNIGGTIVQDASISLTAANVSVSENLDVTIDNNTNGGSIGGAAVIDMNPSGTVTVTNNASVQMLNSGLEGSAAINFNGGTYNVGGTFSPRC